MIVTVKKHKHTYKIIGTAHGKRGLIMCDLACDKCGRVKTVYVHNCYEKRIMRLASEGEYFNISEDQVIDEKYIQAYLEHLERG